MNIHRPPEELLLGYASGSLPEPIALAVAAQAALCPETAREIRRLEDIGGALLHGVEPAALKSGALDRALAALDTAVRDADELQPSAAFTATPETRALLPAPVWPYIKGDLKNIAWRQRAPSIETAELVVDAARRSAFLLRVKGGHPVPRHTHRGLELTLVLAGSYCDAANCFVRGDIQVADPTIDHQPLAGAGEDCICLVALEAPIWFTGPVGRLANPFVRL
jgi:putative transcriptional regulator